MNYMDKIAEMLGVEMRETFDIKYPSNLYKDCFFDDLGLHTFDSVLAPGKMNDLLNGNAEIVKKPFRPKNGDEYCLINLSGDIECITFDGGIFDLRAMCMGNCFRTMSEAKEHKDEIMAKFREVMDDDR